MQSPYYLAQQAIANLKESVYQTLKSDASGGLTNAQIGRSLGIYMGHVRHEGHISRTLLSLMENEGIVEQNTETKKWVLRQHFDEDTDCELK